MKIVLGCGNKKRKEWVNCDIEPKIHPDLCFDMEKFPWPIRDNCATEVISEQVLEHVDNFISVMNEIWRICKNGAVCTHVLPHGLSVFFSGDPTHKNMIHERTFQYFNRKNRIAWGLWDTYGGIISNYEIVTWRITDNTSSDIIPNSSLYITLRVVKP